MNRNRNDAVTDTLLHLSLELELAMEMAMLTPDVGEKEQAEMEEWLAERFADHWAMSHD